MNPEDVVIYEGKIWGDRVLNTSVEFTDTSGKRCVKMVVARGKGIDYVYFDAEDREKLSKITWFVGENGYAAGRVNKKQTYMHHFLTDHKGNGKKGTGKKGSGDISIDHIDGKPLNNRSLNLRKATIEVQQANQKGSKEDSKRERPEGARALPKGIQQKDMPRYVYYGWEPQEKSEIGYRDFFKIELPDGTKIASSKAMSKSGLITSLKKGRFSLSLLTSDDGVELSIIEVKLRQIRKILAELNLNKVKEVGSVGSVGSVSEKDLEEVEIEEVAEVGNRVAQ